MQIIDNTAKEAKLNENINNTTNKENIVDGNITQDNEPIIDRYSPIPNNYKTCCLNGAEWMPMHVYYGTERRRFLEQQDRSVPWVHILVDGNRFKLLTSADLVVGKKIGSGAKIYSITNNKWKTNMRWSEIHYTEVWLILEIEKCFLFKSKPNIDDKPEWEKLYKQESLEIIRQLLLSEGVDITQEVVNWKDKRKKWYFSFY